MRAGLSSSFFQRSQVCAAQNRWRISGKGGSRVANFAAAPEVTGAVRMNADRGAPETPPGVRNN